MQELAHIIRDARMRRGASDFGTEEAKIICDDPANIAETAQKYHELQSSVQAAAKRGYVDSIIDADSVRKHLIYAFEMLYTKSEDRPAKKHGTV